MEITKHDHGVPSWVDIGTDVAKGTAFYSGLFGWECPPGTEETGFYSNASIGGKSVAGIGTQQMPDMPPYWTTYISADSADAIAEKVPSAGGSVVVEPMDVMDFGRMAIFTDASGAFFGVWQAGTHIGAQLVNEPNTLSWNELVTSDQDAAKRFYGEVFGWGANTQEAGPMSYTEWKLGDRSIGGMMGRPPGMPDMVPDHWAVYFAVADLDAAVAKIAELGGNSSMDPIDTPAGKFVPVFDDCGAAFNVIQLSGEM